jgi:hypothetical protein
MATILRILLMSGALAAVVPACAQPPLTGVAPPTRIPDGLAPDKQPVGEAIAISKVPRSVRRAVVAAAAKRFNVAESAVVLSRAERVTWSDAALGCPEHGRMYAQALVPGFRLEARAQAGLLVYHTDQGLRAVTCAAMAMQPAVPER